MTDSHYPSNGRRRQWLFGLGGGAVAAAAAPADALLSGAKLTFPPAVFDATENRALVGVWGNRAVEVHVRFANAAEAVARGARSQAVRLSESSDFAAAILLTEVPSGVVYYAVYLQDDMLSPVQSFRCLPDARQSDSFALAFSGDMEERYRPFRIYDKIAAQTIDLFVHLGDTVYADIPKRDFSTSLAHYRTKHANIRRDRHLQAFLAKHSVSAVWDDHEIENDAHGSHPALANAEQAFREYWPTRSITTIGLYRKLHLGKDVDLFILDTRRFRSKQSDEDGVQKTMLGAQQKAAFIRDYLASRAPYRFIATSVPFHGGSKDAWGNYETERDELLAMFREANAKHDVKTVLLSADYHFAREWPRNEKRGVFEFTAGPLASFLTFEKGDAARERNSRGSHFVYGERANFGLLRYDAPSKKLALSYFDDQGKQLHSREL